MSSSRSFGFRRMRVMLVLFAGAAAFVALSPFGSAPAKAYDYNHPCVSDYQHPATGTYIDNPVSDYRTKFEVQHDTRPNGQLGVCVSPIAGTYIGPQATPWVLVGVGVGANTVAPQSGATGFMMLPQACVQADPVTPDRAECFQVGGTGADVWVGAVRVCADGICQRVG